MQISALSDYIEIHKCIGTMKYGEDDIILRVA